MLCSRPQPSRGFTLIETLIATVILVPALTSVAFLFVYSTGANISNRQRTTGTLVLAEKMEQLRVAQADSALWNEGQYQEYVRIEADGSLTASSSDAAAPYLRIWKIAGDEPRTATVIVFAERAGLTRQRLEVARGTLRP